MEKKIDAILTHMSKSHKELARIMTAKKDVVHQMAQLIATMPDRHDSYSNMEILKDNTVGVTKSITSYLNGLADLMEAINDNMVHVMSEMNPAQEE